MKIAIIGSIWINIPPLNHGFGSQEYLTYHIAEKMTQKGHDVTLFASKGSKISGNLVSASDKQVIDINFPDHRIKDAFELINLSQAYKTANKFDIVHNHLLPYGLLFSDLSKTPTIHTLHHQIYKDRFEAFLYKRYKVQNFVSISNYQRSIFPELNYITTVYNGTETNFYTFKELPEDDYILHIGRMKKYKGIHTAIQVSRKTGKRIKIAAPMPTSTQYDYIEVSEYWQNEIKPHIGKDIEYFDNIAGKKKLKIIQNAKALIFPVEREEPFGMTLIESMSCGTPVVAFAKGATTEIIEDGKTGFIVNTSDNDIRGKWIIKKTGVEGLIEAIEKIYSMDENEYINMRKNARLQIEKKFSIEQMTENYMKTYESILTKS